MPYVKNPDGSMRFVKDDIESPELEPIGAGPQWDEQSYTPYTPEESQPSNLGMHVGQSSGYAPESSFASQSQHDYQSQEDVRRLIDYLEQKRKEALARGDNEAAEYYEDTLMSFDPEEGIDKYGRRIPKYDQEYFIKNTVGKHARDVLWSLQREEKEVKASHVKKQINASVTMNPKLRKLFADAIKMGFRSYDALRGNTQTAWGARLADITRNWPPDQRREYMAAAETLFNEFTTQSAMDTNPEIAEDHERGKEDRRRRGYTEEQIESSDNDALISEGRDVREQDEIAAEENQREVDRIAQTDEFVQKRVKQESEISEKPKRKGHWTPVVGPGGRSDFIPTEADENYNKRLTQWRKSESAKPLYLLQRMLRLSDGEIPSTEEIIERINIMREATGLDPFPFDADDPQTQALLQGLVNKAQQWNKEEGQKGIEYRDLMLEAQRLAELSEKEYRRFSLQTGGKWTKYKDEALRLHRESLKTLGSARKDFDEFLRPRLEAANRMDVVRMWEDVFGAAQFNINKTTAQENLETLHFAGQSTLGHTVSYVWHEQGRKEALARGDDKAVKYHENALADLANPGTPLYDPDPARAAQMVSSYNTSLGPGLAAWYDKYWLPSRKDSPLARAIADIGIIPVSWAQAGGNMAIQGVGGVLQIAGIPGSAEFNRSFVKLNQQINAAYDKLHTDAYGETMAGELALARSGIASLAAILGVSLVTGGAGGMATTSAIFWGSSFSESYVEAKEQGKSGTEAYVYGNIMGFAEVAPMMIGAKWLKMPGMLKYLKGIGAVEGGALTNAAKTGLQSAIRRWSQFMTKDLLKSMGEESFQELLTLAIGRLAQGGMGMETFENSFEGWLEQITEVIKATAYSMGAGQLAGSVGEVKRQNQQLGNAAAAGKKIKTYINEAGEIVGDHVATIKISIAVRDNLAAFTAFVNNPTRPNAAKLGIPIRKGESREAFAKRIKPIVDFYTTEANNEEANRKRQEKGQEPLPNGIKQVGMAVQTTDIDGKPLVDNEGNPVYRNIVVPVKVDPNIPAEEQQEAAEEKASKHKTVDGKPAQVVPKSETHQKTTVTVQDESGNKQDLIVWVPKDRITEDRTAEDIASSDLAGGVLIDEETFTPVATETKETPAPQDSWKTGIDGTIPGPTGPPKPPIKVEGGELTADGEKITVPGEESGQQVDPEAPSTYTGAGVGKPVDQQVAEQEQQSEVEEDIEEDVEEDAPIENSPTTPTQRQFKIVGQDQIGQEITITVWAEDENDAFAKGKNEGVTGTKIKKTREKNTFQEDDVVEDDAQQEEQPAPEEKPSSTSTDASLVEQWINTTAEERGMTPQELADEIGESLGLPTKGDSVEGAAARIANNNKDDSERDASIDEQLDAVGKEEAPVEETTPGQTTTEATPTQEEAPQYNEYGYDKEGFDEEGYNSKGLDREGFRRDGTDKDGVTKDGRIEIEATPDDWRDPEAPLVLGPNTYKEGDTIPEGKEVGDYKQAETMTIEEAEAKEEELRKYVPNEPYDKVEADINLAEKLHKQIAIAKQRQGETAPETAPTETTQEEAPQYNEYGYDNDGVTEDGMIEDPNPLLLRPLEEVLNRVPPSPVSIEEAEASLAELKEEQEYHEQNAAEGDIALTNDQSNEIAKLEKQIAIAKQRRGETAPETTPTQETTQEKAGPSQDSRTWTPEEETQKVQQGLGFLNKRNKQRRKNARPAKVVQPATKEGQRAVELADSLGVKLVFVDNMIGAGGMAFEQDGEMTGVIFVKKGKEGDALFQVVFHELAHGTGIDKIDLGLTEAEMDDLLHEYLSRASKSHQAEIRKQFEENPELARREAVATLMGRIATDPDFRAAYAKDNPTTFGKIVDAILEFFNLHPEAKLSKAQKNLLSELRNLHQKKTVEPAATFESSMESVLELSPEEVRQEAKKRKLPIGGQSTTAQREAVADDMHKESLADSVEMDPDIITERVQDNLRGKKLEDPGDFTADDFDVLEEVGGDPTSTFTLYDQSNKDGYIQEEVNKAKRLPGYSDAAEKATRKARGDYVKRVKAGDRTIPEGTEVTVGDWTFTMGADNAGKSYPTLLSATYSPQDDFDVLEQIEDDSGDGITNEEAKTVEETEKTPKGECYSKTARYAMDSGGENTVVVHGRVTNDEGKRFGHAWIEEGGEVFDPSTGVRVPKDRYYKLLNAEVENRYSSTHVSLNLAKVGKHGPWTAEEIGDRHLPVTPTEAAPKKKPRRRPQTTSGQYIGAPKGKDTTSKLRTMLEKVEKLAKEGEYGRFWYERSSQQILDLVKGDKAEAERLVMAIAITSSSTPVAMNFDFALQAYSQWKAGKPITTGRFPKAMIPKLQAAFEGTPWEGIKTNHFYTNLMRRIDPSKVQGVTHDIWMMRAFGHMQDSPTAAQYEFGLREIESIAGKLGWEPQQVQAAVWVAMKAKMENSDVKKATEAESVKKGFMTYVTNKKGKKERKILNEEEHRKIWFAHANKHTATEADKEGAKFDYKNASEDILAQISHETKPGRATNHFPELFDAPYEQQVEFHQGMSQVFLDDSGADYPARVFSILSPGDFEAPGFYKSTVSPGTQMLVVAPKGYKMDEQLDPSVEEAIRAYAAVRGILQKQDSVGYHRAFFNTKKRDQNGVEIQIGRPFTEAEIKQLADAIKEKVGHDEYSPISTPNGVRLIEFGGGRDVAADLAHEEQLKAEEGNPEAIKELKAEKQRADRARGVANKKFRNIIQEALSGIEMEGVDSAKVKAFAAVGGEVKNNWEVNKNGEGYMADGFRGRPDLLGKARDIIGELHEKVQAVEDEFAQKYGWTKNEEIGIPQEKTLEQVDNETADAARKTTEMHEKFLQKVRILIDGGMHMNEAIQQITDEYIEGSVKAGVHRDVAASRAVKAMGAVRGALGRGASKNASTVKVGVENVPITVSSANSVLQQLLESHESETQLIHPDPHAQMSQFRDAINLVGDSVSQLLEHAEAISLSPAQAKIRLASKQQAIMTLAINYIQMELRADSKRLSRAKSGSPEARNIAARQLQNLETLERFVLGNQRLGTETARAMQLRKGKNLFDNLDLDPIEVLALATEIKGKPLTPEEKAEINKTVEEQKDRAAKAKAARQKVDQAQAESTFNKEKKRPILGEDGKPKKVNTRANVAQLKKLLNEGC